MQIDFLGNAQSKSSHLWEKQTVETVPPAFSHVTGLKAGVNESRFLLATDPHRRYALDSDPPNFTSESSGPVIKVVTRAIKTSMASVNFPVIETICSSLKIETNQRLHCTVSGLRRDLRGTRTVPRRHRLAER